MSQRQRERLRTKHLDVLLDQHEVESLLSRLCVRYGICLPPIEIRTLCASPPRTIDEFTKAALAAGGYGYTKSDPLYVEAWNVIAQAFSEHLEKRRL